MNPPFPFPPGPGTGFGFDNRPALGSLWVDGNGRPRGRVGIPGSFGQFDAVNNAAIARGAGERRIMGGGGMMGFGGQSLGGQESEGQGVMTSTPGGGGYGSGARRNPRGQVADPYDPRSRFDPRSGKYFAEGGLVTGPGDGDDDLVPAIIDGIQPARLSSGEHVDKASTVAWHGLKTFQKLEKEADEGMAAFGALQPGAGNRAPGTVPSFAAGGPVTREDNIAAAKADGTFDAKVAAYNNNSLGYTMFDTGRIQAPAGVIANPYADNPAAYAATQQRAYEAQLSPGMVNTGMGSMVLNGTTRGAGGMLNPATGFAVIDKPGAPGVFHNKGDQVTMQPGMVKNRYGEAPGFNMVPVPDVVKSGPWAGAGMMDDVQARRAAIAAKSAELMKEAPAARGWDEIKNQQKAALINKGRAFITVPDQSAMRPHGGSVGNPFWEREAAAKEAARASEPQSRMQKPADVKQKDWGRYLRSPEGRRDAMEQQAKAQEKIGPGDLSMMPFPGGRYALPVAKGRMAGGALPVDGTEFADNPAAIAALLRNSPDAGGLDPTQLAQIAVDERYDEGTRTLARKALQNPRVIARQERDTEKLTVDGKETLFQRVRQPDGSIVLRPVPIQGGAAGAATPGKRSLAELDE